jgi:hypothetical protein
VGTDELSSDLESWSIFPNPNNGESINIQLPASVSTANIVVYDLLGKVVFQQQNLDNQQTVNLNKLPKGLYTVELSTLAKDLS